MNNNLGEKMKKKWSKETIEIARKIIMKHTSCKNANPIHHSDKLISDLLTEVEGSKWLSEAKKLTRERA